MHAPRVQVLRTSQPPSTVARDGSVKAFVAGESLAQRYRVQYGCVGAGCRAWRGHVSGVADHDDPPGRDSVSAEIVLRSRGEGRGLRSRVTVKGSGSRVSVRIGFSVGF